LQTNSLFLFFIYCAVLLTNRTFLMFFWSGTETALFDFLVLRWVYLATDKTKKHPVGLSLTAVLLSLTRWDGALFLPFTLITLCVFFKNAKLKSALSILLLGLPWFYVDWMQKKYGSFIPLSFSAYYKEPFPFGTDYIVSFAVEYALWFWLIFAFAWAGFKILRHRKAELAFPALLAFFFIVYATVYSIFGGADILSYRPLSFFVPLITLAALRMITENRCFRRLCDSGLRHSRYVWQFGQRFDDAQTNGISVQTDSARRKTFLYFFCGHLEQNAKTPDLPRRGFTAQRTSGSVQGIKQKPAVP